MLPEANRLKKKKDFESVFKRGQGFKEGFLILKIAENKLKNSRFGFVVGKTVSKKAIVRNKIKRRLRDLVKTKIKKIKEGIDGVFLVRPGLESKDFRELEEIIKKILSRSNILK